MRFRVGRHHGPRRPGRAGGAQQLLVSGLVGVPLRPRRQVVHVELPVFERVVQAILQALALLVLADVQHELQDERAVLAEHALKVVQLRIALLLHLRADAAIHHRHQHVFVMAAVEDDDFAIARHLRVNAPQVVVRQLDAGGPLPRHHAHTQRAGVSEHATHRAVLARGVHALQHDQELEALVAKEHVLQLVDFVCQCSHTGFVFGLFAARKRLCAGVHVSQFEAAGGLARGYLQFIQDARLALVSLGRLWRARCLGCFVCLRQFWRGGAWQGRAWRRHRFGSPCFHRNGFAGCLCGTCTGRRGRGCFHSRCSSFG